jgi:glycosyltransferase involved in cell wall biosynthesis
MFIIVGNGPEKNKLIKLSNDLELSNIVFFVSVKRRYIPSLLSCFDSLYIGLQRQPLFRFGISPNKLLDYMMAGVPVIQAVAAGNDIVSEAKCGITVEPEDIQAVAQAVMQLYRLSDKERKVLGKSGRKYVMKNHDYKKLAGNFLNILEK